MAIIKKEYEPKVSDGVKTWHNLSVYIGLITLVLLLMGTYLLVFKTIQNAGQNKCIEYNTWFTLEGEEKLCVATEKVEHAIDNWQLFVLKMFTSVTIGIALMVWIFFLWIELTSKYIWE